MSMSVKTINGQIRLITGLHIGAGNDEVHIGGVDLHLCEIFLQTLCLRESHSVAHGVDVVFKVGLRCRIAARNH